MNEKLLQNSLDAIVEECVSFVGVDLNTCSMELLQYKILICNYLVVASRIFSTFRRISGLNKTKAKKILEFRQLEGKITNRKQLLALKNIGPKTFEQCAGFVRIYGQGVINESTFQT